MRAFFALPEKINRTRNECLWMFLYQIIEWIGDVADRAQRVGNRLELLMAR